MNGAVRLAPWRAIKHSWRETSIYDANGRRLCLMNLEDWEFPRRSQEALEADQASHAALIAAAPDLLAALRFFATEIGIGENPDYRPTIRLPREAIIEARAAVDKALGRAS